MCRARNMFHGARRGDFEVVTIPAMMITASVRCEMKAAYGRIQTFANAREKVQVVSLETVVVWGHERSSPFGDIADLVGVTRSVKELSAYVRVCTRLWHVSGLHENGVNTIILQDNQAKPVLDKRCLAFSYSSTIPIVWKTRLITYFRQISVKGFTIARIGGKKRQEGWGD